MYKIYLPLILLIALLQVSGSDTVSHKVDQENSEPVIQKVMKPQTETTENRYNAAKARIAARKGKYNNGTDDSAEYVPETLGALSLRVGTTSRLDAANKTIEISTAQVLPKQEHVISAGIQGILTRLSIKEKDPVTGEEIFVEIEEGQNVRKGQEIGTIDDSIELKQIAAAEAMLNVAIAEEQKLIEIEYAKASLTVAVAEEERNRIMNENTPNTVPAQMVLEAKLKRIQASKQLEKAKYDLETVKPAETNVKEQELAIAETRLEQRRLVSRVDGIVDEVIGHEGEWFREGDDILRITQYDTLRVKGRVNLNHATPREIFGKTATITAPPLGKEAPLTFTGKVTYARQTVEADNHYIIFVEVKNQLKDGYWLLNPGRYVDLKIKL